MKSKRGRFLRDYNWTRISEFKIMDSKYFHFISYFSFSFILFFILGI